MSALMLLLMFAGLQSPDGGSGVPDASTRSPYGADSANWRSPRACGRNAAYVLARLHAVDISYEDLVAAVPVGERGSSLLEVVHGLTEVGMAASAVRGSPRELRASSMPIIAHLDSESGLEELGHFVVLTSYDEQNDHVAMIDGSTGLNHTMNVDRFRRMWSGYAIRIDERGWPSVLAWIGGVALSLLIVLQLRRVWPSLRRSRRAGTAGPSAAATRPGLEATCRAS